jgi:hypothetical protein
MAPRYGGLVRVRQVRSSNGSRVAGERNLQALGRSDGDRRERSA